MTSQGDKQEIEKIFERVMNSVNSLDYEAVRNLIPDDGIYFGSVATKAQGYDELYEKQFKWVWPNISDFRIVPESVSITVSLPMAWAICQFESTAAGPDGKPMDRCGRMTFVFEKRDDAWVMVHSHDSLDPEPVPSAPA